MNKKLELKCYITEASVIKKVIELNGERHITYGIKVKYTSKGNSNIGIKEINDISTKYDIVENFVILLKRNNVSMLHIYDIIEDYIG